MGKPPLIKQTTNYDLFDRCEDNRRVNAGKHRKLKESMEKYGFLPYWPVICHKNGNGKFKIDDGQHRFHFAKLLKVPVFYIENVHDFDIPDINNTQAVWRPQDYAYVWSDQGVSDYTEVLQFVEDRGISLTYAFAIHCGVSTFAQIRGDFEKGNFTIKDRDYANRVANTYCPVAALDKAMKSQRFLEACMYTCRLKDFEPKRLIEGASKQRAKLTNYGTCDDYLLLMEELYNHNRRGPTYPLRAKTQDVIRGVAKK